MIGVRVTICRYVDEAQPGWVECRLVDVHGAEWSFVEKVPVVTAESLDATGAYPREGVLACEVIERRRDSAGREVVVVDTGSPWQIAATSGESRFEVRSEQLLDVWPEDAPADGSMKNE